MKMTLKNLLLGVVILAVTVAVVWWLGSPGCEQESSPVILDAPEISGRLIAEPTEMPVVEEPDVSDETETSAGPQTEEEKAEAAEEASVDAFDALTDKWMDAGVSKVDMKAIAAFVETFRKVPEARRDECIHRALNLIPDENVMLLAGVLMDKSISKEIVETVFNDVLNRDEDVKKPILLEIFKDKTHPCWADTAWILDVTGEIVPER